MKYYLVAGEKSGDLHASNLMRAIKEEDSSAEFRYWGGENMQEQAGVPPVRHYKEMSYMGIIEVIKNLRKVKGFLEECKKDIVSYQPDVLILVDFAGMNLRLAQFAHKQGVRVHYYIAPKIWAWNQKRAYKVKESVERLYTILPFEKAFYQKFGYEEVDYVGNPIIDAITQFKVNENFKIDNRIPSDKPIMAVLPGSRNQEVKNMLEVMMSIRDSFKEYHFVIAGVRHLPSAFYDHFENRDDVTVVFDQTYDLLTVADVAAVTSGTATLETALFKVPQVVCYKMIFISALILKMMMKVKFVSLVNLIAEKEVVKELLQIDFTAEKLKHQLKLITENKAGARDIMVKEYENIIEIMGGPGASERTGKTIVKAIRH